MAVRVKWEDQYLLGYRTTAIGASDSATSGLFVAANDGIPAIGPAGEFGFLLDEHPAIDPGVEIPTTEKTTGLSEEQTGASAVGVELTLTKKLPKLSIGAMGMTEEKFEILLWSLFQKGASETGVGPYQKTFIPYVQGQSEPEMYLDIARSIGDPSTGAYGHLLAGAICTQLSISGSQSERYTIGAEFMGRTFRTDYDHSASVLTSEDTADAVFLNFAWTLASSTAKFQKVELTIANNAVAGYYNELVPTLFTLHRMAVTGSFSLAMSTATIGDNTQIDNFVAGTDVAVVGTKGSTDIVININAHYTGSPVDPAETELLLDLPFKGVYDGTNHAIDIDVYSDIERSIPA